MKSALIVLPTLMALSFNAHADAFVFYSTTAAASDSTRAVIHSPSLTTSCVIDFCKIVVAASEDITAFIASEGVIRTAALEQVLQMARENNYRGQDLQIASQILGELAY